MRQGSSVPPSESLSQGLHPVLQAALDSLDIELEEELIRYRRQKYRQVKQVGQKSTLSWRSNHRSTAKPEIHPVDLPRFQASADEPGREQASSDLRYAPVAVAAHPAKATAHSVNTTPRQDSLPDLWVTPPEPTAAEGIITPVAGLSGEEANASTTNALMAIDPDASLQQVTHSEFGNAPDDYLASSEELLRSIAEEPSELRAERESNLLDTLLTPLGVGSMLLLLLSSATLGYVIMHPSSLDGLVSQGTPSTEANRSTQSDRATASSAASAIPDSPNLAAEEFVNLNIDTLSTIPRSGSRATTSPPTAASGSPAGSTTKPGDTTASTSQSSTAASADSIANLPPEPALSAPAADPVDPIPMSEAPAAIDPPAAYVPEPEVSDPAPQVATAITSNAGNSEPDYSSATSGSASSAVSSASSSSASSAAGNYYYVVTPYNGDPSLEEARTAVPDAYVRNFSSGASVQLGAFNDAQKAEALVQQLEQQGISAELYQPR